MRDFTKDLENLSSREYVSTQTFEALAVVADYLNAGRGNEGRELLFHLMDHDVVSQEYGHVLSALVATAGVYPYLKVSDLRTSSDLISYEAHRPENSPDVVLHSGQLDAYLHLINGENVILSAPTSFGKSLLIDILISTRRYKNTVVIVPTIALIDETRRRLQSKFGDQYKLITHASQAVSTANIFVLTQERFLEIRNPPKVDLFVIDEFYKLSPTRENGYDDRTISLNAALMKLIRHDSQFLLIGPNIERVVAGDSERDFVFIKSDFRTVGSSINRINANGRQKEMALSICQTCDAQTLIFCSSIGRVYKLGEYLLQGGLSAPTKRASEFSNWLADNYSGEWSLVKFLRAGIAIHHSSLPRSVAQYILHLFNDGDVRFLLCTSTIIEGVNTSARNIIVYDNKVAKKKYDYFTFNNIKGRAGRMFRHMVGHIYILNPEPQEELPLVEIPAMSLPEGLPLSLALEAEAADTKHLSSAEIEKLRYLHAQNYLPVHILKENSPFDPEAQIEIARRIYENPRRCANEFSWTGRPSSQQLKSLIEVIYTILLQGNKDNGIVSWQQLCFRLLQVQNFMPRGFRAYFDEFQRREKNKTVDDMLRTALSFLRTWMEFQLPRCIVAVDKIQKHVFHSVGFQGGDYGEYAESIKHWFRPPAETILEEYGVPMSMTARINRFVQLPETVDGVLSAIASIDIDQFPWSNVERQIWSFAFPRIK